MRVSSDLILFVASTNFPCTTYYLDQFSLGFDQISLYLHQISLCFQKLYDRRHSITPLHHEMIICIATLAQPRHAISCILPSDGAFASQCNRSPEARGKRPIRVHRQSPPAMVAYSGLCFFYQLLFVVITYYRFSWYLFHTSTSDVSIRKTTAKLTSLAKLKSGAMEYP